MQVILHFLIHKMDISISALLISAAGKNVRQPQGFSKNYLIACPGTGELPPRDLVIIDIPESSLAYSKPDHRLPAPINAAALLALPDSPITSSECGPSAVPASNPGGLYTVSTHPNTQPQLKHDNV